MDLTEAQVDRVIEALKRTDTVVMYAIDQLECQIRVVTKLGNRCLARIDAHDYPISLYHIHPLAIKCYKQVDNPWGTDDATIK